MSIQFFGKIDLNKDGKIASKIPAWAMRPHIEELEEEIGRKERALEAETIPMDSIPKTKEDLRKEKKKLQDILESKPTLTETEQNKVWKIYKDLGTAIKPALFSRSDMMKGLASAHEEMRRMKDPVMSINREVADICESNGIRVTEKKEGLFVSRDGAIDMWKHIGRYLGEQTNVEILRKD